MKQALGLLVIAAAIVVGAFIIAGENPFTGDDCPERDPRLLPSLSQMQEASREGRNPLLANYQDCGD